MRDRTPTVAASPMDTCACCGEAVDVASVYWRVCAGCLARHHPECWRAAGGCARCRDSLALLHPATRGPGAGRRRWAAALAIALALLTGMCVDLGRRALLQARLHEALEAERARAQHLAGELDRLRREQPPAR